MNPIVELVETELAWFQKVLANDEHRQPENRVFPRQDNLWPIPFFGDIRRARILTLCLNPAHDEFARDRHWYPMTRSPAASAPEHSCRLLHYFDLPEPTSHRFFKRVFAPILECVQSSYAINAAHMDLLSLPTFRPREMRRREQRMVLMGMLSCYTKRLNAVLRCANRKKVLMILDLPIRPIIGNSTRETSVAELFKQHCQQEVPPAREHGSGLLVLAARRIGELQNLVLQNRPQIRRLLLSEDQ
jgi:hypothetical protein